MPLTEQPLSDRIVVSRDICHGKPRITGTRIMVYQVVDLHTCPRCEQPTTNEGECAFCRMWDRIRARAAEGS